MMKYIILLLLPFQLGAQQFSTQEIARWKKQAQQVTIIRDKWGIPHVYGKTDADAVFGLLYAQCEDDFARVEANYIEKLGRRAEIAGEKDLYNDLLVRLVLDSAAAKKDYEQAPAFLKKLCNAFADGINFYLYTHPKVKPALLKRFQPWWPLLWTDGSIGAISTGGATIQELQSFYTGDAVAAAPAKLDDDNELGSNGFAFAPSLTASHKAMLYINPHVTFYFRPEVHIVSEEGLNAYGAVTWGQFFIYQGFNPNCGWMHTSSQADVADLYAEKVSSNNGQFEYLYDGANKPMQSKNIGIGVNANGKVVIKNITTFYSHHGPVIAKRNGQWLSLQHHNRSLQGLIQSWNRTKAKNFATFKAVMDMKENTSNNTVYADKEGNIAYWHGNFMPKRNPQLDWSKPVDGSTSATEWKGLHPVSEMITLYNPSTGWIQNCNSTPFTSSGSSSLKKENFPTYMAPDAENFRGINAVKVWSQAQSLTIDKVIEGGYTRYLPAFEKLVPALQKAWLQRGFIADSLSKKMNEAVQLLNTWDRNSDARSLATTLAVEWAQRLLPAIQRTEVAGMPDAGFVEKTEAFAAQANADALLQPLQATILDLQRRFPGWQVPWGEINRYQRLTGNLEETYSDTMPSIPVHFAAATWGALPSYVSRPMKGTNRRYGVSGNSFICVVEFGEKIKAKSLLAGGNSSNPKSKHFADQAAMYASGQFKDVLFYKADVLKNAERSYKPGQ
ncbi:MAG TPA: penicillin acylase family protein [Phnomibacter sp.]|nr:penicillin acylase family protein [Phnomibacter sp.]